MPVQSSPYLAPSSFKASGRHQLSIGVRSSPCLTLSSSNVLSRHQSSTPPQPSGVRIPQPFPDLLPLEEPNWPQHPPAQIHGSAMKLSVGVHAASSTAGAMTPVLSFVEIICWIEVSTNIFLAMCQDSNNDPFRMDKIPFMLFCQHCQPGTLYCSVNRSFWERWALIKWEPFLVMILHCMTGFLALGWDLSP